MHLYDENKQHFFSIEKVNIENEYLGSFSVDLKLKTQYVSYEINNWIWFFNNEVEQFIKDLKVLDEKRQGQAILKSMSPDECEIKIFATDSLGHLGFMINCSKNNIDLLIDHKIQTAFIIDPTSISSIINDWKLLLKEENQNH